MAEQVEQEISGHFELSDDDDLLYNLLPMRDVDVQAVKARIEDWQQITRPFKQAIANTIVSFLNSGLVHSHWASRPDEALYVHAADSAEVRPDAACVLGDQTAYFAALDILESMNIGEGDELLQEIGLAQKLGEIVAKHANNHLDYWNGSSDIQQGTGQKARPAISFDDIDKLKKYTQRLQDFAARSPAGEPAEDTYSDVTKAANDLVIKSIYPCTNTPNSRQAGSIEEQSQDAKGDRKTVKDTSKSDKTGPDSNDGNPQVKSGPKDDRSNPSGAEDIGVKPTVEDDLHTRTGSAIAMLYRVLPILRSRETFLKGRERQAELLEKLAALGWVRINTPLEMKPVWTAVSIRNGSAQLIRYMRLVLKNQLDRRFVFGILICGDRMRVFYCDRSSLVTTKNWINILSDSDRVIHVVLALSSLSPFKLGWDPTMKLRLQSVSAPELVYKYSTDPSIKLKDYGKTLYDAQWAIFVPAADAEVEASEADPVHGTWYATTRALSLTRAEVMTGRATLVWMVKELQPDLRAVVNGPPGSIKVLKSAWAKANSSVLTEKQLVGDDPLPNAVDIQESVRVGKQTTSTGTPEAAIRGGIVGERGQWSSGVINDRAFIVELEASRKRGRPEDTLDVSAHTPATTVTNTIQSAITPRILTRTIMRTYGWPVKYFTSLVEFVSVVRDSINGHRELYMNRKVAHQDVSLGNVLAHPVGCNPALTRGVLIDLDHAKQATSRIRILPAGSDMHDLDEDWSADSTGSDIHDPDENWAADWPYLQSILQREFKRRLGDEDLGRKLWQRSLRKPSVVFNIIGQCANRCGAMVVKYGNSAIDPERWAEVQDMLRTTLMSFTPDLLQQLEEEEASTNLQDIIEVKADSPPLELSSVGTLPFMSYEMLKDNVHYPPMKYILRNDVVDDQPVHGAIHDLESYFWVFLWLHRPRRPRRSTPHHCFHLFDNPSIDGLAANKLEMFKLPNSLEQDVLPYVHSYFDPVKRLLIDWWDLLRLSYAMYDNIEQGLVHGKVLALLDDALERLRMMTPNNDPGIAKLTEMELERRRTDLRLYQLFPNEDSKSTSEVSRPLQPESDTVSPKAVRLLDTSSATTPQIEVPDSPTMTHRPAKRGKFIESSGEDSMGRED
ncbi:hypothetical protein BXZ70DRAFT_1051161 [Cristinia sonorae]|uniref:Fungal-type protein kinase domain-containing protein n=1 Tax=Cristinia sonorae TaxID=1940300 RepID=A0A8K0UEL0_9AGAR|nr:hypothetical protein BXZ70DRAFT_1051161 [Cristinia sonorae]